MINVLNWQLPVDGVSVLMLNVALKLSKTSETPLPTY